MEDPILKTLSRSANSLTEKRGILMSMIVDSPFACFTLGNTLIQEEQRLVKIAELAGVKEAYLDRVHGKIM